MAGHSCIGSAAAALAAAGWLCVTSTAGAEVRVSIRYDAETRLELADRLRSELESEGYEVSLEVGSEPSPCEPEGSKLVSVQHGTKAWIRLSKDPVNGETIVASICFLGAMPFLQQASSSAPGSQPQQLAVATAEALNGLRAKLPPLVAEPVKQARRENPPPAPPPVPVTRPFQLRNALALGPALMLGFPDHPPALAVALRTITGLGSHTALVLDAAMPATGAELRSPDVTATVRTAWLRLGPRLHTDLGDLLLAGALLGGPAVTWATAVARSPRVGTSDVSTGALFSLSGSVEYPKDTPVYAAAATSISLLLPGVRVKLGDATPPPRSFVPFEASMGLGLRWGS